jgi:ferredoxin-NADP reductase
MPSIILAVREIRQDQPQIRSFRLVRADGGALDAYTPGAHLKVRVPGLKDPRCYSLVNTGTDDFATPAEYRLGVRIANDGQGGSRYMHGLKEGVTITVQDSPANDFPLADHPGKTLLIAGGIGITPIWSMIERLEHLGRPWQLHYSCRTREEAVLLAPLAMRRQAFFNFDDENAGVFLDIEAIVGAAPAGTHFYCCGPAAMLARFEAAAAHIPREQVHVEHFSATQAAATQGGFTIELARSGLELLVPPGRSILETLRDNGVDVNCSCEQGLCGVCETEVLSGVPDHRDSVLTEAERAEGRKMMICCSGSKTDRLVLDI